MCDCDECKRREHELTKKAHAKLSEREVPTLNLAALGLYHSERMTITGVKNTLIASATVTNDVIVSGNISGETINPVNLHRLPGAAINAYPLVKDVAILARVTAGTTVTPFLLTGFLIFRDNAFRPHIVGALTLSVATSVVPTNESLRSLQATYTTIILSSSPLGENAPANFGSWEIQGTLALGTATEISFDIWANIGVLYGVPK